MAPKAADGTSVDAANFKFIFAALKHNKSTIEPAWDEVAKECGISYGRNANTKFKDLIKRHGYKLESGKIVPLDGSATALFATPKKPAQSKGRTPKKTPAPTTKRKATVESDEENGGGDQEKQKATKRIKKDAWSDDRLDGEEDSGEDGTEDDGEVANDLA